MLVLSPERSAGCLYPRTGANNDRGAVLYSDLNEHLRELLPPTPPDWPDDNYYVYGAPVLGTAQFRRMSKTVLLTPSFIFSASTGDQGYTPRQFMRVSAPTEGVPNGADLEILNQNMNAVRTVRASMSVIRRRCVAITRPGLILSSTRSSARLTSAISHVRIQSVEMVFGTLKGTFAFVGYYKNQRLLSSPIAAQVKVGMLLANCLNCLHRNVVSHMFDLPPPILEEYISW